MFYIINLFVVLIEQKWLKQHTVFPCLPCHLYLLLCFWCGDLQQRGKEETNSQNLWKRLYSPTLEWEWLHNREPSSKWFWQYNNHCNFLLHNFQYLNIYTGGFCFQWTSRTLLWKCGQITMGDLNAHAHVTVDHVCSPYIMTMLFLYWYQKVFVNNVHLHAYHV